MKEIWELYNENGEKSGVLFERGNWADIPRGLYALGVEIWIRVGEDKLLFTRRHPDKYMGLMWETVGGGVVAGESGLDGAVRELAEEVGIILPKEDFRLLCKKRYEQIIVESYIVKLDTLPKLSLQDGEVVDARLVRDEDVREMWESLTPGTRDRYELYKDIILK